MQISLNALSGVTLSLTMQLGAVVANKSVHTLVDSESIHCFIAQDTVRSLSLSPTTCPGLRLALSMEIASRSPTSAPPSTSSSETRCSSSTYTLSPWMDTRWSSATNG